MTLNYDGFGDDTMAKFREQAVMEFDGLMDIESWLLNDEDVDCLPDADQIHTLTSLFDIEGEF